MLRSPLSRVVLGAVAAIAVLTMLRFRPWEGPTGPTTANDGNPNKTRQELTVGFLPVT
jgi:hypothetical protein